MADGDALSLTAVEASPPSVSFCMTAPYFGMQWQMDDGLRPGFLG
jgi:hypothetical protein